jgi:phosphoribosylformylglycinamidine cyclo-ligase
MGKSPHVRLQELEGKSIAEVLLAPHRSYLAVLEPLLAENLVHALAHITGGGFFDNIPRVLPEDLDVEIRSGTWRVPPIFRLLEREGDVSFEEMHRVFNMGIGMVVFVAPSKLARATALLLKRGEPFWPIGQAQPGHRQVTIQRG